LIVETCIEYCEPGWAWMSTDERRWINKLRKLAHDRPDECVIVKQPEDNDGFIYAKFPQKWVRVNPPKVVNMTEEERAARAAALLAARKKE
jgi:hypothetical protein